MLPKTGRLFMSRDHLDQDHRGQIAGFADELHAALQGQHMVQPLIQRDGSLAIDGAHAISLEFLARRMATTQSMISSGKVS